MVTYTNKHNLPDYVVAWLKADQYDYVPGVLSATTLLQSTRMIVLNDRHTDDIVIDVSDRIAARYGTDLHAGFERVQMPEEFKQEERMFANVLSDIRISGKYDMLKWIDVHHAYKIVDLKSTSVWKYVYGEFDDYTKQLSTYRWLCVKNGLDVIDAAEICMIFTDWSKSKARAGGKYPPIRIQIVPIPLESLAETEKRLILKVLEIQDARKVSDDQLPICSPKELWQKPAKFAVRKPGRASAVRNCETEEAAIDYIEENGNATWFIECIPSKAIRCEYCTAWPWCNQYRRLVDAGIAEQNEM